MARKSKTQVAVEDFELQFENLVQEYLANVDLNMAINYFQYHNLIDVVWDILNPVDADEEQK